MKTKFSKLFVTILIVAADLLRRTGRLCRG